jgi:hypothetical protein
VAQLVHEDPQGVQLFLDRGQVLCRIAASIEQDARVRLDACDRLVSASVVRGGLLFMVLPLILKCRLGDIYIED